MMERLQKSCQNLGKKITAIAEDCAETQGLVPTRRPLGRLQDQDLWKPLNPHLKHPLNGPNDVEFPQFGGVQYEREKGL